MYLDINSDYCFDGYKEERYKESVETKHVTLNHSPLGLKEFIFNLMNVTSQVAAS